MNNYYDIIIKPVLSEKSYDGIAAKRYVSAVEHIFGVTVDKVNTVRVSGKVRRGGRKDEGTTASYKKAYVTLTADSKAIEFFESLA